MLIYLDMTLNFAFYYLYSLQLSSVGIIRLPKFEMAMAKSEDSNKPVLAAEDVQVITV